MYGHVYGHVYEQECGHVSLECRCPNGRLYGIFRHAGFSGMSVLDSNDLITQINVSLTKMSDIRPVVFLLISRHLSTR